MDMPVARLENILFQPFPGLFLHLFSRDPRQERHRLISLQTAGIGPFSGFKKRPFVASRTSAARPLQVSASLESPSTSATFAPLQIVNPVAVVQAKILLRVPPV
jgi:predicted RNase H-like nuclease